MDVTINELKTKIIESISLDRSKQLTYCNMLLQHAKNINADEDIAYAYLGMADYSYYVTRDMHALDEYLDKAKQYLTTMPSANLVQYYTLKAMNNDSTYDFLNRLDAYLAIIKNANEIDDQLNVVTANGNIAELFRLCRDYQMALTYSVTVYEQYKKLPNARDVNKAILLTNIVEISCHAKDTNKALYYINELKKIPDTFDRYQIYLNICLLRYHSIQGLIEDALKIECTLRNQLRSVDISHDTKYECLMIMFEAMVSIHATQRMEGLILFMESIIDKSDINRILQIQKNRIEYYTMIDDKILLGQQYKSYVKTYEQVEILNRETKIKGICANLEIQTIRRNEENLLIDNRSLENDSMIDMMTTLYNRRYFNKVLLDLQHDATLHTLGIAIFDVDYFKEFNDIYGHLKGDQALTKVGKILKNTTDDRVIPCRFGGDEFICIFTNMNDEEIVSYIVDVMDQLKSTSITHIASKCANIVTLSIGYGMEHVNECFNQNEFLEKIDQALYGSKRKGRDTYTKIRMAGGRRE